jgi:hypothetical protein
MFPRRPGKGGGADLSCVSSGIILDELPQEVDFTGKNSRIVSLWQIIYRVSFRVAEPVNGIVPQWKQNRDLLGTRR